MCDGDYTFALHMTSFEELEEGWYRDEDRPMQNPDK